MLNVLATRIAPSARPDSEDAGTVAVQAPAPLAPAATVLPAESMSVTPVMLAPGCETPVTVRSLPAFATLMSARLVDLASLGAYGALQPPAGWAVAPDS